MERIDLLGEECVLTVSCDITARKHAEEALAQSERLFRLTLDALPVSVAVVDIHGDIILANPAARQIWSEIVHDGRTASLFDPGARTFLPLDGSVSLPERTGRLAMPTLDRTAYLAFRNREEDHERVLPIAGTENVLLVQEEPRLPIDSPARTQTKTIHLRVV